MKKIFLSVFTFILAVSILPVSSVSADETGRYIAGDYGICLTLEYSDGAAEGFQDNIFLIYSDSTGFYVQAEYVDSQECYLVTGYTTEEAAATRFRCGNCLDRPGELAIRGMEMDTYSVQMIQTTEGYMLLKDDVTVMLSDYGSSVDGNEAERVEDGLVPLEILIMRSFKLPDFKQSNDYSSLQWVGITGLFITFVALLLIVFLPLKKE